MKTINRHGGDVRLAHLPDIGMRGNKDFMQSDLKRMPITGLASRFMAEKNWIAVPGYLSFAPC